ncbi:MAG: flippase [Solirubrobacteraceae bacterium]
MIVDITPAGPEAGRQPPRASAARNASVLGVATIVARLLMFGMAIVLARRLGAESYGRYALAVAIGVVLQPVADFGLTPYLSREAARDHRAAEATLPVLVLAKAGAFVVVFGSTLLVAALASTDSALVAVIAVTVLACLADGVSMFVYAYFQGREAMAFEARSTAGAAIVRAVGAMIIAVAFGALGPVVAWILLVALAQCGWAVWRLRRSIGPEVTLRPRRRAGAVQWASVGSMGLIAIFVMIYLRVDSVLIGVLQDARAVGLYAAAYTLMLAAQIPPWMIATALTPAFARSYGGDRPAFVAAWHQGLRAVLLISLPITLTTTVLAGPLISRFYGDEFAASAGLLALLIWVGPLGAISLITQAALRGAGREFWLVAVSGTCAGVNVAANLWAIPRYGVEGAAVVTLVTEGANTVALVSLSLRAGIVPIPRLPIAQAALACAALAGVAVVLSALPVELAMGGALVAYVAVLIVTRAIGAADFERLRRALRGPD